MVRGPKLESSHFKLLPIDWSHPIQSVGWIRGIFPHDQQTESLYLWYDHTRHCCLTISSAMWEFPSQNHKKKEMGSLPRVTLTRTPRWLEKVRFWSVTLVDMLPFHGHCCSHLPGPNARLAALGNRLLSVDYSQSHTHKHTQHTNTHNTPTHRIHASSIAVSTAWRAWIRFDVHVSYGARVFAAEPLSSVVTMTISYHRATANWRMVGLR